jgi:hypothetical protein
MADSFGMALLVHSFGLALLAPMLKLVNIHPLVAPSRRKGPALNLLVVLAPPPRVPLFIPVRAHLKRMVRMTLSDVPLGQ